MKNRLTIAICAVLIVLSAAPSAQAINTEPVAKSKSTGLAHNGTRAINTEPIPSPKTRKVRSFSPSSIRPKPTQFFPGLEWKKQARQPKS